MPFCSSDSSLSPLTLAITSFPWFLWRDAFIYALLATNYNGLNLVLDPVEGLKSNCTIRKEKYTWRQPKKDGRVLMKLQLKRSRQSAYLSDPPPRHCLPPLLILGAGKLTHGWFWGEASSTQGFPCALSASETEAKSISICIKHALQSTVR